MQGPIFAYLEKYGFRKLVLCHNADVGLKAVIAVHSTALGPACGGLRMWTYASENDAIMDALRLGRGLTYKYAAAGVNLGGGKANSCSILEAFQLVESITRNPMRYSYVDQPRAGDHICYYSDLRKMRSHYPQWDVTRSLSETLEGIVESWYRRVAAL